MLRTNPFINKFTLILLLLSGVGLSLFYFKILNPSPWEVYFSGTLTGLSLGLLIRLYYSFANPSDWLFQYRYHLEGIAWVLLFGSFGPLKYFFGNDPVSIYEIIIPLIAGLVLGMLWINSAKYKTLKDWRGDFIQPKTDDSLFSDAGTLTDAKHLDTKGTIMLSKNEVIFSPSNAENQKIRMEISALNPQLEKSGFDFLKMPTGIQLSKDRTIQPQKFPKYWLEKIKAQKKL